MPMGFDRCENAGGRIKRISGPNKRFGLKKGEYMNICFDGKGNMHRGYVHIEGKPNNPHKDEEKY